MNSRQWTEAIQSLSRLQPLLDPLPDYKARVNTLLARCYDQQGDPSGCRMRSNGPCGRIPITFAQRALIATQAERGEFKEAIEGLASWFWLHPRCVPS